MSDAATLPLGIALLDSDHYTRSLLTERIARLPGFFLHAFEQGTALLQALPSDIGLLVLNHHATASDPHPLLQTLKQRLPALQVVAITSPGQARRQLAAHQHGGLIDVLLEKPLDLDALIDLLQRTGEQLRHERRLARENFDLMRFLPTGGVLRLFRNPQPGRAELFDLAILFTDLRNSSHLIEHSSAQDYFHRLSLLLGEQARLVRLYDGMVVKTTGDGLLAIFEGAARSHLALKCARAIRQHALQQNAALGMGISEGLALLGILGTPQHMHFDVIGKQVHLAARLCALAQPGEILCTEEVARQARLDFSLTRHPESIRVRGFSEPVPCLHLNFEHEEEPS